MGKLSSKIVLSAREPAGASADEEEATHPPNGGPASSGLQKEEEKQQQPHSDAMEKQNRQQHAGQQRGQGDNQQRQGGSQLYSSRQPQGELPQWPGQPRGALGKPGQVSVNYLDVNLDQMPAVAYHYDVKITPERPKNFYRQAFEQYRVEHLGGAIAAFDGRASCYSVVKLKCSSQGQEVKVYPGAQLEAVKCEDIPNNPRPRASATPTFPPRQIIHDTEGAVDYGRDRPGATGDP
ncbi:GL13144 [Drosophila persimilis]|uniref:GL13144 n=1 Tax=Drosophila persimilis TaxID=7234 RepID=B4HBH3_DROPE|nr:GL13144 [Drosophila persimilis]